MGNPVIKRSIPVFCFFFVILVLLCAGCSKGSSDGVATDATATTAPAAVPQSGGALTYIPKTLNFTAGQSGSIQLDAAGGQPPYIWRGKAGALLPSSFSLNSRGILTGTPPDLTGGATQTALPPYNAILKDSAGAQVDVELNIIIVQP